MNRSAFVADKVVRGSFFHVAPKEMATFVRRDFETLRGKHRMRKWFFRGSLHGLLDRLVILADVLSSDFNVSWFGYHQAYWAVRYSRKFGRKSMVILGGFDVCEEEDPNFASRVPEVRYILRNADRILAVSNRLRDKALEIEPDAEIELVYHGFDPNIYRPSGPKKRVVTTVAYINRANLKRKGLETFVKSAESLPEYEFLVVGEWLDETIDHLRSIAASNVSFSGRLPETELIRTYQDTAVYVQASTHEGFGCSLAEAMLCECVPVVSDRGAIPEVVGKDGIYIDPESVAAVADGIKTAMENRSLGARARRRVMELFPLEKREAALIRAVDGLFA